MKIFEITEMKPDQETFRQKRLPTLKNEPYDTVGLDVPQPDAITDINVNDHKEIVAKVLKRMPERLATSLYFEYFKGKTVMEISKIFGVSNERSRQINAKAHRVFRREIIRLRINDPREEFDDDKYNWDFDAWD